MKDIQCSLPLSEYIRSSLIKYFANFEIVDARQIANLYSLVISEVEKPLLETVLDYTKSNQSKAAKLLGVSRNTLRKLIVKYSI